MVSPLDLLHWQEEQGEDFAAWCLTHLAASPGALVLLRGQVTRIPTLVPRRLWQGKCHWLTPQQRCAIHAAAPFGCAAFDCTMPKAEADRRSQHVLFEIYADRLTGGPYSRLWDRLHARGQVVRGPEEARRDLPRGGGTV